MTKTNKTEAKTQKRSKYYHEAYLKMLHEGKLTGTVLDPCCVLRDKKHSPGVYWWYVYDLTNNTKCTAYVGETADLYERCLEHLKRWFYNDQTFYYLGISSSEFGSRYILMLEAEIDSAGIAYASKNRREEMEKAIIVEKKPYTICTDDPKQKINPTRFDSCIWHKYRREAFLKAIAG